MGAYSPSGREPVVSVDSLSHFITDVSGSTICIARDISFNVYPGEILAIVGPSGCGKTTLLTLLGGIRSIQSGSIRINQQELSGSTRERLSQIRSNIGIVFQSHRLISFLSAKENIIVAMEAYSLGEPRNKSRAATRLLDQVRLSSHATFLPSKLSGGQRQRVALARALANDPCLLIADEPTSSLDSTTALEAMQLMQDLCRERNMGVIMSTHDSRILSFADRVMYLINGTLTLSQPSR